MSLIIPDADMIEVIFPNFTPDDITTTVLSNSSTDCTFRAHSDYIYGFEPTVRLQVAGAGNLQDTALFHNAARAQLGNMVPEHEFQSGTLTASDGRELHYTVTAHREDKTLVDVWTELDQDDQQALMGSLVGAVKKLHGFKKVTAGGEEELREVQSKYRIGGPHMGNFDNMKEFLAHLVKDTEKYTDKNTECRIEDAANRDGITIKSVDVANGTGAVTDEVSFTNSDLSELEKSVVLCHGNLEPRNIFVQEPPKTTRTGIDAPIHGPANGKADITDAGTGVGTEDSDPSTPASEQAPEPAVQAYELAAISGWQMAGFFPFAYELALQDKDSPSSWSTALKTNMAALLPEGECHQKLIKVVKMIESAKKSGIKKPATVTPVTVKPPTKRVDRVETMLETTLGQVEPELHTPGADSGIETQTGKPELLKTLGIDPELKILGEPVSDIPDKIHSYLMDCVDSWFGCCFSGADDAGHLKTE